LPAGPQSRSRYGERVLRRLVRNTLIILAAVGAAALIARALVSRLRPSPDQVPAWPPPTPAPDQGAATAPAGSEQAAVEEVPTREPVPTKTPVAPKAPVVAAEPEPAVSRSAESSWVDPDGDSCPTSHPIKAKLSSGIYHSPGGLNYERTKPDRCYVDGAAAEADGLRPSKR
jgi:hypothetical protein